MAISRRKMLRNAGLAAGGIAVGAAVGRGAVAGAQTAAAPEEAAALASGPTTVTGTVALGSDVGLGYRKLVAGAGEPHVLRTDITTQTGAGPQRPLVAFAQMSDLHIIDDKSTARLEFLDWYVRHGYSFGSAYRPNEFLSTQLTDAMCRAIANVGAAPATGLPLALTLVTGDVIDNCQYNETRWYIDILDGRYVIPRSGSTDEHSVHSFKLGWQPHYWHPERKDDPYWPGVEDEYYKVGFPQVPGLLAAARRGFTPHGLRMPWYAAFGNHDRNVQGNLSQTKIWAGDLAAELAVGQKKPKGTSSPLPTPAPAGGEPGTVDMASLLYNLQFAPQVAADPNRRLLSRGQFIQEHFTTTGLPVGHGFANGVDRAYYAIPARPDDLFQFLCLDTTKDDSAGGTVGAEQMQWLESQLKACHSRYELGDGSLSTTGTLVTQAGVRDKLVVVYCHHTLSSIDNGAAVKKLLLRFPNVIMLVDGHTHDNRIWSHARGRGGNALSNFAGGFWEINTASHVDWPIQSRIIEVADDDGVLSIYTTMVDIDAPLDFSGDLSSARSLASLGRELAANDPQEIRARGTDVRRGAPQDRNARLLLPAPFDLPVRPARVAAAHGALGSVNVFALNGGNTLFGRRESAPDGWTGYLQFDDTLSVVTAETATDGGVQLFGLRDGRLYQRRGNHAAPATSSDPPVWLPWSELDSAGNLTSIAAARYSYGALWLFAVDATGGTWRRFQSSDGSWSGWFGFDSNRDMRTVAAATGSNDGVWLLALSRHGRVLRRTQGYFGTWTAWTEVPGQRLSSLTVARNADGRLQLFGSDLFGRVHHAIQTGAGVDAWSTWTSFGPTNFFVRSVAAETLQDGRMSIYAVTGDNLVFTRRQISAGSSDWYDWYPFPLLTAQPVAVPDVRRKTKTDADWYLRTHGGFFRVGSTSTSITYDPAYYDRVVSQYPAAGTLAAVGSAVNITLGRRENTHL